MPRTVKPATFPSSSRFPATPGQRGWRLRRRSCWAGSPNESIATMFFTLSALRCAVMAAASPSRSPVTLNCLQLVDAGREIEILRRPLPGVRRSRTGASDRGRCRRHQLVRAGQDRLSTIATGVVGERGQPERRHLDAGAFEQIARRGIADGSANGARRRIRRQAGGRSEIQHENESQEIKCRATNSMKQTSRGFHGNRV